jgi:hypothetical protein
MEATRAVYLCAKHQHNATIAAHQQANDFAIAAPNCNVARSMEREAKKARIQASKKETKGPSTVPQCEEEFIESTVRRNLSK